ncbi:MAG: 8-amino-7-oxononanoate synthase [Kiritimatiellae bacterium]|nr:8-amino-7-oxononanoate synthase [Kiritimatiellia bacterium]
MSGPLDWIGAELGRLTERGRRRRLPDGTEVEGLNLSSNDYLGLARHPAVIEAAVAAARTWGVGATASPHLCGRRPVHVELEQRLARLKRTEAALVFSSGYAANVGVISALVGRGDVVFADRLVHASLLDGARLSGAVLRRFQHNDPAHLEQLLRAAPPSGRRMIVTESVFSMDGDRAPLPELARLAEEHGALLYVDEAHALGVYGPGGAGALVECGLSGPGVVAMGTLSKALGSQGGFVAGSAQLREWLVQAARSLMYSTGLSPVAAAAALAAVEVLEREPERPAELRRRAARFRERLHGAGLPVAAGDCPIVPVILGEDRWAMEAAGRLRASGVHAVAIRPPTVPEGAARIRFSVTLNLTPAETDAAAEIIGRVLGVPPS